MEQQHDKISLFVPEITLPDDWNSISLGSSNSNGSSQKPRCKACKWNRDPLRLCRYHDEDSDYLDISALDFLRSAQANCIRCQIMTLLIKEIFRREEADLEPDDNLYFDDWNVLSAGIYGPTTVFTSTDFRDVEALRGIPKRRPINIDTSTEASLRWAQDQIESHQTCWDSQITESFVPTRLIDVDPNILDGDVYIDDEVPKGSKYIALSYCWGEYMPQCQTTSKTLSDRKQRIPWSTLPKTLQDAITFTRRLGIQYLWVDCVCILQGDSEDWARESSQMFHVYRHSYVTLAAVWGRDSNSGLFSTMADFNPRLLARLRLGDEHWPLYVRRSHAPIFEWGGDMVRKLPLFRRAWAYQERLISTRVLYFTQDELAFECFCDAACECGVTEQQLQHKEVAKKKTFFDVVINHTIESSRQSNRTSSKIDDSPMALWRQMASQYSWLNLSDKGDRLPAIGAVAEQFQLARPGERYLAGLWSGSLLGDLMWYGDTHTNRFRSSGTKAQNRGSAPTWSWAFSDMDYIGYPIQVRPIYQYSGPISYSEVVEASCSYVDDNPFGVLTDSSLKLRGRLRSYWVIRPSSLHCSFYHWDTKERVKFGEHNIHFDNRRIYWRIPRKLYLLEISKERNRLNYLVLRRANKKRQVFFRVGVILTWQAQDEINKTFEKYSTLETVTLI
ncbi:heterokaryon incompatibility protein-domain-containing protein [Hypomontagnella monticulosa]|nr:heterokaryon incompatibility protein-domain-containing protein [Hypomontagnella monticulosa]